jgi:hypothetical protein
MKKQRKLIAISVAITITCVVAGLLYGLSNGTGLAIYSKKGSVDLKNDVYQQTGGFEYKGGYGDYK